MKISPVIEKIYEELYRENGEYIDIRIPKNVTSEHAAEITKQVFDGYHDFDAQQKLKVNTEEKSEKKTRNQRFRFEVSTSALLGFMFSPCVKIYKDEVFFSCFIFTGGISDLNSFIDYLNNLLETVRDE